MENKMKSLLLELGLIQEESVSTFYPEVRDNHDIVVLRCETSGIILLSRTDHIGNSYYKKKPLFSYQKGATNRKTAVGVRWQDVHRRYEQLKDIVRNNKWVDVGTDIGGIFDLLEPIASKALGVEPQKEAKEHLIELDYEVYPYITDLPSGCIKT